jgi:hypothetical protein
MLLAWLINLTSRVLYQKNQIMFSKIEHSTNGNCIYFSALEISWNHSQEQADFQRITRLFRTGYIYLPAKIYIGMDIIWYFIGDLFRLIFSVVPFFGLWINKLLIVVGFVAIVYWMNYMKNHKTVEKWD